MGSLGKATCLHILSSNATHISRVLKEANSFLRNRLAEEVIVLAKWDHGLSEREDLGPGVSLLRIKLATRLLPRRLPWQIFKEMEWRHRVVRHACELRPHTIFCHSVVPLRTAVEARRKTGAALVYDAHELETERTGLQGARKRAFAYLERRFIGHCGAVICVSDSIADWYAKHYGICRPIVVRNIPDPRMQTDFAGSNALRQQFGVPGNELLFIYQGGLEPGRRVEQMLRIFTRLGTHLHIVFMGFGTLEAMVREAAGRFPNIHFQMAVPPHEVLKYTASADIGIVGVENNCLSYYFSLPNKLFEYLLASIPALVPDYPEMRRVVDSHGCGWKVPEGDEAWQKLIESLTAEDILLAKARACTASGRFSWRNEETALFSAHRDAVAASQSRKGHP